MAEPDWRQAEELLFERSRATLRRFGRKHPGDPLASFAYTVDSLFAGVGLNFDTQANSLSKAKDHQRHEVEHRDRILTSDSGWEHARYYVTDPARQIDDFNRYGSWQYELFEFVPLAVWEVFFSSCDDHGAAELEGRVITALWRVVNRLVEVQAFDGLRRAPAFRIGFEFHDGDFVVLRILDWPGDD
jgi:hypothetical protein